MPIAPAKYRHAKPMRSPKPSATERGYDYRWQLTRAQKLKDNPLCEPCLKEGVTTLAVEVDHIVPKSEGGQDEPWNLQAICKRCHKAKTRGEIRRATERRNG